jgi:RNA polymerase sigma-B factor
MRWRRRSSPTATRSRSALMPEAVDALAVRAAGGDAAARAELVERLMPRLSRLARRFAGRASQEDLEQAGVVGVLSALSGYDPDRGTAFATYATPFAAGEMLAVVRASAPVHVSRTGRDLAATVVAAADAVTASHGRSPSPAEIADAAGLDEEDVVTGLAARVALGPPESEGAIEDAAGAEDATAALAARLDAGHLIRALDRRSQAVLVMRFGLELSQEEIGERLGISQMHVSRLLRAALAELNALMDAAE